MELKQFFDSDSAACMAKEFKKQKASHAILIIVFALLFS